MSDVSRAEASPVTSKDDTKAKDLDEFVVDKLSNYVRDRDSEVGDRTLREPSRDPEPPKEATKTGKPKIKLKNSARDSKTKSTKGKTPANPSTETSKTPLRRSPRVPKRKAFQEEEDDSPSPLAKKSKTTDAMADVLNAVVDSTAAPQPKKKASSTSVKSKAMAAPKAKAKAADADSETYANTSKKRARAAQDDDDQVFDAGSERPAKAKKAKKAKAAKQIEGLKDYETAAKGSDDSATERPDFATLDVPWKCGERMCNTGMTWLERGDGTEKSNGYGRKSVSHFFGRNKKETGYIDMEVWHWLCRKCYQRNTYEKRKQSDNSARNNLVSEHIKRLRHQIIRLQIWRPQMVFKVQLTKAAKSRLAEFHKALTKTGVSEADAIESVAYVPQKDAKGKDKKPRAEHEFPIIALNYFDDTYAGTNKTFADLVRICDWIDGLNEKDGAPCDPPIEFLPSKHAEGEVVVDPAGPPDNYDLWAQYCDAEAMGEEAAADSSAKAESADDDEKTDVDEADEADEKKVVGDDATEADEKKTDVDDASAAEGAAQSSDGENGDDDDESDEGDDGSYARPAPSTPRLWLTPLGRKLGFKGNAGIKPGTGIRAEREREEAERQAALREQNKNAPSETSEVKIKSED